MINVGFLPSATKLRRLCFYRRLSVHRGGVSASVHAGIPHPPREQTPWEQTPPPPGADTPLEADTPPEQTPPWSRPPGADTPREQTPPRSRPAPRYGHCCGRYASYWNAFLLILALILRIQHMQIVWKCSALWLFRNAHIISCSILCSVVVIINRVVLL